MSIFEFEDFPIPTAIFLELFCSLHMSFFVLIPIAEIINKKKYKTIFAILFFIRFVILFAGNFINPGIALMDFFAVFIGAFIVVPIVAVLKKIIVYDVTENDSIQTVSAIVDMDLSSYIKYENGKIMDDELCKLENKIFDIHFQKNVRDKGNNKKCPNCGAPIKLHDIKCDYCLSVISDKSDWKISKVSYKKLKKD